MFNDATVGIVLLVWGFFCAVTNDLTTKQLEILSRAAQLRCFRRASTLGKELATVGSWVHRVLACSAPESCFNRAAWSTDKKTLSGIQLEMYLHGKSSARQRLLSLLGCWKPSSHSVLHVGEDSASQCGD